MEFRTGALACLTAGAAAAEAAALHAAGMGSITGIAPHALAPPPFGTYHDLRWVFVVHSSWAAFGGELVALLIFRTLLNTVLTLLAWPSSVPRPGFSRLLGSHALGTVLLIVVLSPWVTLAAMGAGTSLSWFVMSSVLGVGVTALILNRAGLVPGWWRHPPTLVPLGLALLTFLMLSAASTAISLTPGWWAVPVAGVCGLANTWLWRRLVHTLAGKPLPVVPAFVTPLALALIPLLLLGIGGHLIGLSQSLRVREINTDHLAPTGGRQVLVIDGYGSHYTGQRIHGYPSWMHFTYYSYRGQYPDGAPLPYGPNATHQSVDVLARRLADQINDLHKRTGAPIGVIAHSEGTVVFRAYLREHRDPPVDTVVLLSPLVRPVRIYYPPRSTDGWGVGIGWEVRLLAMLSRWQTGSTVSADEPFVRSILAAGPYFRNRMLCPVPGIRIVAFLPTASAAAVPPAGHLSGVPVVELRAVHGSLTDHGALRDTILTTLTGGSLPTQDLTSYELVQGAAAGWQAPSLPLAYVPTWRSNQTPDAPLTNTRACDPP